MLIELRGNEKTFWQSFISVLMDPFYYALRLPSIFHVLFFTAVFIALLTGVMILVWFAVRGLSFGMFPDLADSPPKMYPALAMVSLFALCAGVIHRRLTREELRGQFVAFSSKLRIEKDSVVFQVIDKRSTQLIGTTIVVDVITDKLVCRRVKLEPPGLLVIPTDIVVPFSKILDFALDCLVCGKSNFPCPAALAAHLRFYHSISQQAAAHEAAIRNLNLFRVRIRGVDEVSGKPGMAEKSYCITDTEDDEDSSFSLIDDRSSAGTDHSPKKYVHVDLKYQ